VSRRSFPACWRMRHCRLPPAFFIPLALCCVRIAFALLFACVLNSLAASMCGLAAVSFLTIASAVWIHFATFPTWRAPVPPPVCSSCVLLLNVDISRDARVYTAADGGILFAAY